MKWIKGSLYCVVPIIMFFLSAYFTINVLLKTQKTIVCPDVRGKNVEEAKDLVESRGLKFIILRYERRNDVAYNHITVQKPEANIPTRKGRVVNVIVSEGPELVKVPVLTGQSLQVAEEILKEKNIEIEKTIYVPHANAGKVVAQIPKGGENILEAKGVILFIGNDQKTYFLMPDITETNLAELSEEMDMKQLKYKTVYLKGELSITGSAIKTSIPPGTIFKGADEILINVN